MIWVLLAGVALVLFGMKKQDAGPTLTTTTTNNTATPTQAPVAVPTPTPQVDAPVSSLPVSPSSLPTMPVAVPTAPPVFQMPDFAAILAQAQAEQQAQLYNQADSLNNTWRNGRNPDGSYGKPDWLKTKVADLMQAKNYVAAIGIMQSQWQ